MSLTGIRALKSRKRRKHSRLKGSQLDLITWYFQDVKPTAFLSSFSTYPVPHPVHFKSFDKNQTSAGGGPQPPTDHRCQNCQPEVLTGGGGGKGDGEWLVSCFFYDYYSKRPPETSREKESDSLVERCEVLTAFLREGGKVFRSLWTSHVILSFFFCVFLQGAFFHSLNQYILFFARWLRNNKMSTFTAHSQPVDIHNLWWSVIASQALKVWNHCSTSQSMSVFFLAP